MSARRVHETSTRGGAGSPPQSRRQARRLRAASAFARGVRAGWGLRLRAERAGCKATPRCPYTHARKAGLPDARAARLVAAGVDRCARGNAWPHTGSNLGACAQVATLAQPLIFPLLIHPYAAIQAWWLRRLMACDEPSGLREVLVVGSSVASGSAAQPGRGWVELAGAALDGRCVVRNAAVGGFDTATTLAHLERLEPPQPPAV